MLTSYRQKYNPKKPKPKVKLFAVVVQAFFKKFFCLVKKVAEYSFAERRDKKSPSPFINGEGHHQNTLHFKT